MKLYPTIMITLVLMELVVTSRLQFKLLRDLPTLVGVVVGTNHL